MHWFDGNSQIYREFPETVKRTEALFWTEWVTAPQIHFSKCWGVGVDWGGGLACILEGKNKTKKKKNLWIGLNCGELSDPPPKRSFTSGNLIAVYLNYRGWDEKRRPNELQVAGHVQTITAGLLKAAAGLLDYSPLYAPHHPTILTIYMGTFQSWKDMCFLSVINSLCFF